MVKLSLVSPKGNHSVRYFPYQGYLGLTPVRVDGFVRTAVEQDGRPILARDLSVAVRCYEARYSRFGAVHMNILAEYCTAVWHKDDATEWAELGDSEHPFRISVPATAAAPSGALYFQGYRVFWRVEAVLNHAPIPAVGSRQVRSFELPLVRYDSPVSHSLPTPLTPSSFPYSTSLTPHGLPLRYRILVPPSPIGPLDIVTVQIDVQPLGPCVSVRSASALVERRIQLNEGPSVTQSPLDSMPCASIPNFIPDTSSSVLCPSPGSSLRNLSISASLYSDDSSRPVMQHHSHVPDDAVSSDRAVTHIFAHAESATRTVRDASGVWSQALAFAWPETKSSSRWTVGETLQTEMATIKFFLRVKLVVYSPAYGIEGVALEDTEVTVVSTNDSQRQIALARCAEHAHHHHHASAAGHRPKSKSPRRTKRDRLVEPEPDLELDLPPSPPSSGASTADDEQDGRRGHTCQLSSASAPPGETDGHSPSQQSAHGPEHGQHTGKLSRRPHTVAGLHDQPGGEFGAGSGQPGGGRPATGGVPRSACEDALQSKSWTTHAESERARQQALRCGRADQVEVRGWEEELARVETASRKSSANMLGFLGQRKRLLPAIRTFLHAEG